MTISTSVDIVNLALVGHLGKFAITAIGESTRGGQLAAVHYDAARDARLRSHPYNFAIRRASLVKDDAASAALAFEYGNAFTLPASPYCLKVIRTSLDALGCDHDYRIEGRLLLTNEDSVSIEYIARVTAVGEYDAEFVQLLALDLAILMCMPVADSNALLQTLTGMRDGLARDAQAIDAQEGAARSLVETFSWIEARF